MRETRNFWMGKGGRAERKVKWKRVSVLSLKQNHLLPVHKSKVKEKGWGLGENPCVQLWSLEQNHLSH